MGLLFSCSCTCNYARYLPFRNLIQPMFTNSSFCSLNYLTAHRNVPFCMQNPPKMFIQTCYAAPHGVSYIPLPNTAAPPKMIRHDTQPSNPDIHHDPDPRARQSSARSRESSRLPATCAIFVYRTHRNVTANTTHTHTTPRNLNK